MDDNSIESESNILFPHVRGFKMASLNIASLVLHIDEIRALLHDKYFDVICLNETRLDTTISDEQVFIDGYTIIRNDRRRTGGGVCIYVRSSLNYNVRHDLPCDKHEILSINISKPNCSPFNVTALYRPPNSDTSFFITMENVVAELDNESIEFFLLGDLNCDYLTKTYCNQLARLKLISQAYQLTRLITEPTRITPTSESLIDVIFTNDASRIVTSGVIHVAISDHSLVYTIRKSAISTKNRHKYVTTRAFKNFNPDKFRADSCTMPWNDVANGESRHAKLHRGQKLFLSFADMPFP